VKVSFFGGIGFPVIDHPDRPDPQASSSRHSATWPGRRPRPSASGLDGQRYPSPRAPYSQHGPLGALPCHGPPTIWCTGAPRNPRSRGRPNKKGRPSWGRPFRRSISVY
jgi:hypothetical protein